MKKIFVGISLLLMISGCGSHTEKKENTNTNEGSTGTSQVTQADLIQFSPVERGDTLAIMETSMGTITLRMFPQQAPKAVENFTTHAKEGYYDNLTFHRVIADFMIQGGDPKGNGTGGESIWGKVFENEISEQLYHFSGALAMANAGADTNGSQFFIVQQHDGSAQGFASQFKSSHSDAVKKKYEEVGGTPFLDGDYTVFGQVIDGMDVVHAIAAVETGANDKPAEDVIIKSITIKEAE